MRLKDSASGASLATNDITFSSDRQRVRIANEQGVLLSLNKWLRLVPSLTAIGGDIQERILDRTEEIVGVLARLGLRPFVVGGTLLGGVREGKLLPHDDDADIAYLSEFRTPAEVAVEGFRVGRKLEALGYTLMRHSATHMQLHFRDESAAAVSTDYYIDVFAAFFTDDGCINQPFHVRGSFDTAQMLPFGTVTISGRRLPAPRDQNAWLELNYDADWRTPIPGFAIVTPEATRRRFMNWFGSFNFGRHFWNTWYSEDRPANPWRVGASWIVSQISLLRSPQLIELGAGDGSLSVELANDSREVIATDFAKAPLQRLHRLAEEHHIRPAHLNLSRLTTLAAPHDFGVVGSFDIAANHVLEQVTGEARSNIYRLIRMALLSGGSTLATVNTVHAPDLSVDAPSTWHLTAAELESECAPFGLRVTVTNLADETERHPIGVVFSLGTMTEIPEPEVAVKLSTRIFRALDPRLTRRRIRELNVEVETLKQELDEFRAQNAKLAELLDLAESRLSPSGSPSGESSALGGSRGSGDSGRSSGASGSSPR